MCLSVTRVYCDITMSIMHCEYFDTTQKGNHFAILTPTVVGGRRSLLSEICAQSDLPTSKNADFDRFPLIRSQP